MQYQIFVENQSHQHFVASVIGMPTIAVDGGTEIEAISNAKAALQTGDFHHEYPTNTRSDHSR